jgi:hypothetical protein
MIRVTENLFIGSSDDAENVKALGVGGVLNVAYDLRGSSGWPQVEYMQVGLIDGPGNLPDAYHAAVLALGELTARHHQVLVCCHTGSRSLAVVLMFMEFSSRRGWDGWLEVLQERAPLDLPVPHEAHREAFDKMHWDALLSITRRS